MSRVFIIGAGGHTKQSLDIFRMRKIKISGIFDDFKPTGSKYYYDYTIGGSMSDLKHIIDSNDVLFCGIGDNTVRQNVHNMFVNYCFINCISPLANVSKTAYIGSGNYIGHYVNLSADCRIGELNIINDGSSLTHDVKIKDYNHICPHVIIGGCVSIGNNNLIGTNATINPKITIGDNNIIGSGSVVIRHIDNNLTLVGNPCKILKTNIK